MKSLLRLLRFLFWWIVILITVAVIGFFLWPLLSGKVNTLRSGDWNSGDATADVIQMTKEKKIKSSSAKKVKSIKQNHSFILAPRPLEIYSPMKVVKKQSNTNRMMLEPMCQCQ